MGGTQPYSAPDLEAGDKKDPDLQPVTPEAGDELTQDTAGPRSTTDPGAASRSAARAGGGGSAGGSGGGGQKEAREIDSDDPRTSEHKRIEDEEEDEPSDLDDSLDDTFPASDPPSHSSPTKSGKA